MDTRCATLRITLLFTYFIVLTGCGRAPNQPGPFGPPRPSNLLATFAGSWQFDFERTLETLKAKGATEQDIQRLRKMHTENPELGPMHPNMVIEGNEAVCPGLLASEYRFFGIHEHDGKICGKAWHHEDRFDPGDMSKCYVRLRLDDDRLYFEVRMQDGISDLNDTEFPVSSLPDIGSSANCKAEMPTGDNWSDWECYVFFKSTRQSLSLR